MNRHAIIDTTKIGTKTPLLIIAGPCVLETEAEAMHIAEALHGYCQDAGLPFVFKGSFDKANRT
ncbi:MAG: hypothetical protein OR996_05155, partial [Phycisphaerales bacterium]|nr:hypothetical protein [Phycisphaerales bacterium]